jgi:hypothetical protein
VVHDPELLDRLDALPKEAFDGEVFRATRQNLDPLVGSYNGGRWMRPAAAAVLYTSLAREGALAEIAATTRDELRAAVHNRGQRCCTSRWAM